MFQEKDLKATLSIAGLPVGTGGEDGATFIPKVSPEGEISWTNNKNLPNPEPVIIKGPKGDTGAEGKTGPEGKQGQIGPKGDTGRPGVDGKQGPVGPQGPEGKRGQIGPQGIAGVNGKDGRDALINNVNTLTLVEGKNIKLKQEGTSLTISSTASGGGGEVNFATFDIDPLTGELIMSSPSEIDNPTFIVNDKGELEVSFK